MMRQKRMLARMAELAAMLRDWKLEELRQAQARRDATEGLIVGLVAPPAAGLSPVAAAQAELGYGRWADARRRELNQRLAREMVEVMRQQDAARRAFGRADVLRQLEERR
ncbi:MAG: hypothetical protein LBE86_04120 [Gemmobacter sp.]|jgi:uncharacterized membrane protein|nr:hypothetical protein [Gemmobacter sp.]